MVIHRINMRFSKKRFLSNPIVGLLLFALLARRFRLIMSRRWLWSEKNRMFAINWQHRLFRLLAGRDSFSDIYGMKGFYIRYLPQLLVLLMDGEIGVLPQTLGPFRRRVTKAIAMHHERASCVYSRDFEG